MNKRDLISRAVAALQDNGFSKKITTPRQVFHISDDEGNAKDFVIRKSDKEVYLNTNDVSAVLDTFLYIMVDSLKKGEEISIHGFGTFSLHRRAARKSKRVGTDEWVDIEARYVPKFSAGNDLKLAAKIYDLSLQEQSQKDGD